VLRAEDGRQEYARRFLETIDDVPEGVVDRGVVADDAHASAAKALRAEQDVRAKSNRAGQ